jgi:hypothetical protein
VKSRQNGRRSGLSSSLIELFGTANEDCRCKEGLQNGQAAMFTGFAICSARRNLRSSGHNTDPDRNDRCAVQRTMDVLRRRTHTHDTADSTYGSATPSFVIPSHINERRTFNSIRDTLSMLTRHSTTKASRTTAHVVPTHFDRANRARADTLSFTQSTVAASSISQLTTTPSLAASSTTSDVPSLRSTMNGGTTPKPGETNHSSSYVEPPLHQTRTARSHIRTIEGASSTRK